MRQRKPFYWKFAKGWYVQVDGKRIPLGGKGQPGKTPPAEVWDAYNKIMAGRQPVTNDSPVADLVDKFLDYVETDRPKCLKWYSMFLRSFQRFVGRKLTISNLEPRHIDEWVAAPERQGYKGKSAACRSGAVRAVSRVFSWAATKTNYKGENPAKRADRPLVKPRGKEAFLSPAQVQSVLDALPDDDFKVYVRALILTGARPGELRLAVCEDYDRAKHKLVLPPDRTKCFEKTDRQREIFLDAEAESLIQKAILKVGEGRIFRGKSGKPLTQAWINSKFRRLKVPFKVKPYYLRHSFVTRKLQEGLPIAIVAALAGHSVAVCERVYAHVNADDTVMQNWLRGENPGQAGEVVLRRGKTA